MKTVKYEVTYKEDANRLELLVRFLWLIPVYIVNIVLSIVGFIALVLQWFVILLTGKRNAMLNKYSMMYIAYYVKFMSYFALLTDERSPIIPEDM